MYNKKNILITGGTGSLGNEITSQLLRKYNINRLVIFSRDELKQYQMSQKFTDERIRYFIGDVRDKDRLKQALRGIDIVIHAAALKHVPICEYNPFEAIKTNILGAQNLIEVAIEMNVEKVIALSTDKAANPINLYGATKLASDKLFVAGNAYTGDKRTTFSVVRYGNVLGSRGSVIPFFQKESKKGVLPITDLGMTRFWITLQEAAQFVLEMSLIMSGGEIFIPKIPSMKLIDLAKAVCPDCELKETGVRPGEKLHEVMIPKDEAMQTLEFEQFYVIKPSFNIPNKAEAFYFVEGKEVENRFEYSSDKNKWYLTIDELKKIIEKF